MYGIMNIVPKTMFEEHFDAVEFMFQSEAGAKGLSISDAERQIRHLFYLSSYDPDDPGSFWPADADKATHVEIMYRWRDANN